ncbi:phage virion morphogenesis protein [Rhizobium mayense]|uniref:Phage virion morphogenesis protein n=1 Tax=Rhizobium mayense TaxID=1312184 RepID=A0ABT7JY75_9HYPH|nr:phage virion morphogenesis protein [Rhizobium mayense]MDL2401260.1 phage virion morphogenesis protein [Rhizobium mayense]
MAGASISFTITDRAVLRGFDQLGRLMTNTRPVMAAIGTELVASTVMRFVTQTDPTGGHWIALNPEYAAGKRNARILTERGRLRDSINSRPSNHEVRIGTNLVYAAIHQFGGVIRPVKAKHLFFRMGGNLVVANRVTLPARPYLGISKDDQTSIAEIVFSFIDRYTAQP